jgi:hypothetical protein
VESHSCLRWLLFLERTRRLRPELSEHEALTIGSDHGVFDVALIGVKAGGAPEERPADHVPARALHLRPSFRFMKLFTLVLTLLGTCAACVSTRGRSLAPLGATERALVPVLRRHVEALASGPRNLANFPALERAAEYIAHQLESAGYTATRRPYRLGDRTVSNIEAERRGRRNPDRIIVIGAHYDSAGTSPGANDNASGVAALIEVARLATTEAPAHTVRFVAFVNEEPPYFMTAAMGSLVYASEAAARKDQIDAMLSLETIGFYSDEPGSQHYPAPFHLLFPRRGNFLAMTSNLASSALLRRVAAAFRRASSLPVVAAPAPERIPGIGWSDHWSFWQHGFPAVMLTDTAPYRYPHYHTTNDTPDKLDYERLARVVSGCVGVLRMLAS